MRELTPPSIKRALNKLDETFGTKWLRDILRSLPEPSREKPKNHTFLTKEALYHPLAFRFREALEAWDGWYSWGVLNVNQGLIECSALGDYLTQLDSIGIANWNGEIVSKNATRRLTSRLKKRRTFDKARFELQVAAAYRRVYPSVYFVEESKEPYQRTPDLLVRIGDTFVEIECKKKDTQTPRDRANSERWMKISSRLLDFLDSHRLSYIAILRLEKDPATESLGEYCHAAEELISEKTEGKVTRNYGGFSVEAQRVGDYEEIHNPDIFRRLQRDEYFDFETWSAESDRKVITKDTKLRHLKIVAFRSNEPQDRIASVVRSFRSAASQLQQGSAMGRPSLMYIEMNPRLFRDPPEQTKIGIRDPDMAESRLKEEMGDLPNAVILTLPPTVSMDSAGGTLSHRSTVIQNESPRNALPDGFTIVGRPD